MKRVCVIVAALLVAGISSVALADDSLEVAEQPKITPEPWIAMPTHQPMPWIEGWFAQVDSGDTPPRWGRGFGPNNKQFKRDAERRRKHLEQFRLLKLLELLELQDGQETPFITAFDKMRRERDDINRRKQETLEQIGNALGESDADKNRLNELIDDMLQIEKDARAENDRFVASCREFLTPEQVAKYLVFQERFEYELLESVRQFRDRGPFGKDGQSGTNP